MNIPIVTDTIGARDCHVGTILACLTLDIPMQVVMTNRCAAALVEVKGGTLPKEVFDKL